MILPIEAHHQHHNDNNDNLVYPSSTKSPIFAIINHARPDLEWDQAALGHGSQGVCERLFY